jgi:hypothetical protein
VTDYNWTTFEMAMRKVGFFDLADLAREKAHSVELGYPFMHFRGRQATGDHLTYRSNVVLTVPSSPVASFTPTHKGRSKNLFDHFK